MTGRGRGGRDHDEEPAESRDGGSDRAGTSAPGDVDRVEPGEPAAENVAFVLLGVLSALYVIARLAGLV